MALMGSDAHHMDCFIVAKWNKKTKQFDWDMDKVKALNERKSTNMADCQKCPVKLFSFTVEINGQETAPK